MRARRRLLQGPTDRPGPLWVVPAVAFFAVFALAPMVLVGYLSLTSWNGVEDPSFIGLDNWSRVLRDDGVLESLKISAILTALCWVIQTPVALLLGVWAAGRQRTRAALTAVFFLPILLSAAAIALLWQALLDPNFGLPTTFGVLGNPLGSESGAVLAVAFVLSWQFIPFHTMLYQAAARQIPQMLYDAATIDGATRLQQLRMVTIPQLRNTVIVSSVLIIVGSMTYFETLLILTDGGPGTSTAILPFRMYAEGFRAYEMGYASAIAVVLVVIGTALSLVLVRFSGYARMRSTLEGV